MNYTKQKEEILQQWSNRVGSMFGKRGVVELRKRYNNYTESRHKTKSVTLDDIYKKLGLSKLDLAKRKAAKEMAKRAGANYDEHGSTRGDYRNTAGLDFVWKNESKKPPYLDSGGEGLGLILVTRKRVYSRSSGWYPRETSTKFLIGKNEIGTYFTHAVPRDINSVREAINWIWNGKANQIIQRQGDIALIRGKGPKLSGLPFGHQIQGDKIIHETHPDLPLPGKGERIIVAKRAADFAVSQSRD